MNVWIHTINALYASRGISDRLLSPPFAVPARYGPAVEEIPQVLRDKFTQNGTVPVVNNFHDQAYLGGDAMVSLWTSQMVDQLIKDVRARKPEFNYDNTPMYSLFDANPNIVAGKRGVVVGSENPWLEAFLLTYGSSEVTTVEYGTIVSEDSRILTYTPDRFDKLFLRGDIEQFDYAFTYSSIEHDGLGRYGDVLNPDGDLQTVRKLMDVVKPGGLIFIGVPCCEDVLVWNAHRLYGPKRFQRLFAGLEILGVFPQDIGFGRIQRGFTQPVWVLKNSFNCDASNRRQGASQFQALTSAQALIL